MTRVVIVIILIAAVIGAVVYLPDDNGETEPFHVVTVEKTDVQDALHLSGSFSLKNPELIRTGVDGRLEWLVEDNSWVDAGEPLFILNDQEALEDLSNKRETLVDTEQDLRIALLKREQTRAEEQRKVDAAKRKAEQASIKHRILIGEPKGGDHLIALEAKLTPKLAAIDDLEILAQRAEDTYRDLEDTFYTALDTWQNSKDEILRIQSEIDGARMDIRAAEGQEADVELTTKAATAAAMIPDLELKLKGIQDGLGALTKGKETARSTMISGRPKRDEARKALQDAEAEILDDLIQVEIEKKRLNVTTLKIDRKIAAVDLETAKARLEEGQDAFNDGALSGDELDNLKDRHADATHRIAVLDQRLTIAQRPPSAEELTESELAVAAAERDAKRAEEARDEALDREQRKIEVLEKQIVYHRYNVDQILDKFPTAMETTITYLKQELLTLEEHETERRQGIDSKILELEDKLKTAEGNPPNVGNAPSSGVVQIIRRWGHHPYNAGDSINADQVLMKLFPPGHLELEAKVNEVEVNRLQPGQPITARVPALDGLELRGRISRISGIGEDIFEEFNTIGGITMFPVQISIENPPDTLRPGMSALISVILSEQKDVLTIPLKAASEEGGDFYVSVGSTLANTDKRRIQGRIVGVDALMVTDGLNAGETLVVRSRKGAP